MGGKSIFREEVSSHAGMRGQHCSLAPGLRNSMKEKFSSVKLTDLIHMADQDDHLNFETAQRCPISQSYVVYILRQTRQLYRYIRR